MRDEAKPIPGAPGYTAHASGVIFGLNARPLKPLMASRRYPAVSIYDVNGRPKSVPIHLLMLRAFVGPKPSPSHEARHLNGVPTDNRAENLAWGTRAENVEDKMRHGKALAVRRARAKLSLSAAEDIRARLAAGESGKAIARHYGVDPRTVTFIKRGKIWVAP